MTEAADVERVVCVSGADNVTHELTDMQRYSRGRSAVFGRPQVGYLVTCSCGWSTRVNGTKREARPYFTDHVRAMKEATR